MSKSDGAVAMGGGVRGQARFRKGSLNRTRVHAAARPIPSEAAPLHARWPARSGAAALVVAAIAVVAPERGQATEGAGGHYLIGAYAVPGAAVLPSEPGFYAPIPTMFSYRGTLGSSRDVPIGGRLQSGLTGDFAGVNLGAAYVLPVQLGQYTLATAVSLPLWYQRGRVSVIGPLGRERERTDDVFAFGDMTVSPVVLGWRSRDGAHFVQARVDVFAPTGDYNQRRFANTGFNYWTFTPTIAYTYLDGRTGLDVSASAGVDINTRNRETDYRSGAVFHLDLSVTKNVTERLGLGLIAAALVQVEDDQGPLARRLNGFRGQSFAVGPTARYGFSLGQRRVNAVVSWVPEFGVRNRTEGHAVYLRLLGAL